MSAITTFLLWLLPQFIQPVNSFEASIALHQDAYSIGRNWVNFVHIFLALTAYLGAAFLLWRRSPGLAAAGFLAFLIWGLTELLGVSINLFAVNGAWRPAYLAADPATQMSLKATLTAWSAIWDAMFFLLLVAFALGSAAFGAAGLRQPGLGKWIGILFLLAVPLTLIIIAGGYFGIEFANALVEVIYPILQPVSRAALALWLWRSSFVEPELAGGFDRRS